MSLPEGDPSLLDYAKAAFFARPRVRGLGDVPVNLLYLAAVGAAGLVMPGILLVGSGLELAYLLWLSGNPRFRNIVRGQRLQQRAMGFAERLRSTTGRLPLAARTRWEQLRQRCDDLRAMSAAMQPPGSPPMDAVQDAALNSLLLIHANLLQSRMLLDQHLSERSGQEIQQKLDDAEKRLAAADSDAMKRSLDANVTILKKRLQHHQSARQNMQVIDSELERIENQVDLIREEASVARDPEVLSARLDAIGATMGDVNHVLAMSAELLGDLDPSASTAAPPPRTSVREGS